MPLDCLISCLDLSCARARKVARTWLMGLLPPTLLAMTSLIPASSKTARTWEPATTPAPFGAGLSSTRAPSQETSTSCGTVVPSVAKYHIFACCFTALADGVGQFIGFSKSITNAAFSITNEDERGEAKICVRLSPLLRIG